MSSSRRGRIRSELFTPTGAHSSSRTQTGGASETTSTSGESRVVRISLNSVREKLRRLAEVGDVPVSQLNEGLLSDFSDMKEVTDVSSNAGNSQVILRLIEEHFREYNRGNIQPGTVAAHFRGCTVGDDFGGDPACSAVCGGSFQPGMVSGWQTCAENVIHLKNGQLNFAHRVEGSDRATLHIFDLGWERFTPSQLELLKQNRISKVALYRYGTGDYSVRHEHLPLEWLPAREAPQTPAAGMKPQSYSTEGEKQQNVPNTRPRREMVSKKNPNSSNTSNNWTFWILLLLALLAIAFGLYYRYKYSKVE